MLKIELDAQANKNTGCLCQLMGSEADITYETILALGAIYAAVRDEFSPLGASAFRHFITKAVLDPASPVWTTETKNCEKLAFRMPGGKP